MTSGMACTATLRTGDLPLPYFEAHVLSVPVELRPWVRHIWVNRATSASASYHFYRAPEVVSHLVFIVDSLTAASGGDDRVNAARVAMSGVQSRLYSVPFPAAEAVVLQLRPGATRALRLPTGALANEQVGVDQLSDRWGKNLAERVAGELCTRGRVNLLCEVLAQQLRRTDTGGRIVRRAEAFATACVAHGRTRELARHIGYSERQLRRVFLDLFGLNPKEFSRVLRMNAVLQTLNGSHDWADSAARHGYHDQSHLIHDFRSLTGSTPERFMSRLAAPHSLGGALVVASDTAC
jgi:AraC-like DNA-binding protein